MITLKNSLLILAANAVLAIISANTPIDTTAETIWFSVRDEMKKMVTLPLTKVCSEIVKFNSSSSLSFIFSFVVIF